MDFNGSRDYHPTGAPCNSSADCEDYYREAHAGKILIPSIYMVVCCLGLSGNTALIYVTLRYAKTKTATDIYILNLALAHQLFMLSVPFLAASAAVRRWPFGSLVCRLVLSVDAVNMFTSVFCLTVLSLDRYVAAVHPTGADRYRRPAVARAVAAGVWGLSLLVVLPVPVFADTVPAPGGGMDCNFVWPEAVWSEAFVVYTFLLGFLLPLGAMGLCYGLMAVRVPRAGWRRRSEGRMTRLVLLLVAVFVVCWTPFYVVQLLSVLGPPPDPTLTQLCVVLSYANSAANPVLYGSVSQHFRGSLGRAACFRRPDAGSGGASPDLQHAAQRHHPVSATT